MLGFASSAFLCCAPPAASAFFWTVLGTSTTASAVSANQYRLARNGNLQYEDVLSMIRKVENIQKFLRLHVPVHLSSHHASLHAAAPGIATVLATKVNEIRHDGLQQALHLMPSQPR